MNVENTTFKYEIVKMEVAIAHYEEIGVMYRDMDVDIMEVHLRPILFLVQFLLKSPNRSSIN